MEPRLGPLATNPHCPSFSEGARNIWIPNINRVSSGGEELQTSLIKSAGKIRNQPSARYWRFLITTSENVSIGQIASGAQCFVPIWEP
jgi:hypothetical protein